MTYNYDCRERNGIWEVFENQTEQVVFKAREKKEAIKRSKFWSKGGGFFGFTPRFMTVTTKAIA